MKTYYYVELFQGAFKSSSYSFMAAMPHPPTYIAFHKPPKMDSEGQPYPDHCISQRQDNVLELINTIKYPAVSMFTYEG
jgi:hypothetical protein